jgi:hypothetical protein
MDGWIMRGRLVGVEGDVGGLNRGGRDRRIRLDGVRWSWRAACMQYCSYEIDRSDSSEQAA